MLGFHNFYINQLSASALLVHL